MACEGRVPQRTHAHLQVLRTHDQVDGKASLECCACMRALTSWYGYVAVDANSLEREAKATVCTAVWGRARELLAAGRPADARAHHVLAVHASHLLELLVGRKLRVG